MSSQNLHAASQTYLNLKNQRGHWHGQDRNSAIDDFEGDRHRAMIELQKSLGQSGTSADEVQRLMGEPTKSLDQPDLVLQHEFNRGENSFNYPSGAKIWIYEWRNMHDFVYFVLSKDNKVIHSGWYHAYE